MAMTFTRRYEMQKENTGSAGAWNSFMILKKDVHTAKGTGYVDKVRIHYIMDDRNQGGSGLDTPGHFFQGTGVLWAAAYANSTETVTNEGGVSESGQLDHTKAISVRANGPWGNVTLPIKKRIIQDGFDGVEMDGDIYLWMKNTDTTTDDSLVWRIIVEIEGRYVKAEAL